MSKAIKKISTFLTVVVLCAAALIVMLILVLKLPVVRSTVANKLEELCYETTGLHLTVRDVEVSPWGWVRVEDVSLSDGDDNAVVGCKQARIDVSLRSLWHSQYVVNHVRIDSLFADVRRMPDGSITISHSIRQDTTKREDQPLPFDVLAFDVYDGCLSLRSADSTLEEQVRDLRIGVVGIAAHEKYVGAHIEQIDFSDAMRDRKAHMACRIQKNADTIRIDRLALEYGASHAYIDSMGITTQGDTIPDFYVGINNIVIDSRELPMVWADAPEGMRIAASGELSGGAHELRADNIAVRNDRATSAMLSARISNYADPQNAMVDIHLNRAETTLTDLTRMMGMKVDNNSGLRSVGIMRLRVDAQGPASHIDIDAELQTGIGQLKTDMVAALQSDGYMTANGQMMTDGMDLTELTQGTMGHMDWNAQLNAMCSPNGQLVFGNVDGHCNAIEINKYRYTNVHHKCHAERESIVMALEVDDPNAHIVMGGGVSNEDNGKYYAIASIDSLRTGVTNLTSILPEGTLSMHFDAQAEGRTIDDAIGFARISDLTFGNADRQAHADSIVIRTTANEGQRRVDIESDIMNGNLIGTFRYADLAAEVSKQIAMAAPALHIRRRDANPQTRASFDLKYRDIEQFAQFVAPDLKISNNGRIVGSIDAQNHTSAIEMQLGDIEYADAALRDMEAAMTIANDTVVVGLRSSMLTLPAIGNIGRIALRSALSNDTLNFAATWHDEESQYFEGSFATQTALAWQTDGLHTTTRIEPSDIKMKDSEWQLSTATITTDTKTVGVEGFCLSSDDKRIGINGRSSTSKSADTLRIDIARLDLGTLFRETPHSKFALAGRLTTTLKVSNTSGHTAVDCRGGIDNFYVNHDYLDHLDISAQWAQEHERLDLDLDIVSDGKLRAQGRGGLDNRADNFDLMFDIDSLSIGFLNFYLGGAVSDIKGTSTGWLRLHGPLSGIEMDAHLGVNRTDFRIRKTNVRYTFDGGDTIVISPQYIAFNDIKFSDRYGQKGTFSGGISHNMFSGLRLGILFDMRDQLVFDQDVLSSPTYYGTIFANGTLRITGSTAFPHLAIDATTRAGSQFYILPLEKSEIGQNSYIKFRNENTAPLDNNEIEDMLSTVTAHMNLDLEPNAQIHVVVDKQAGNMMSVRGAGRLGLDIDRAGDLYITGQYEIDEGTYNFSFENILNKRFVINKGSLITWDGGNPYNAILDVVATYKLKASLYDLMSTTADMSTADLKRRVPINCNLLLSGRLYDPGIKFKIEIPSSLNFSQYAFDQYVSTEEEMNRQAFSLLLTNRFYAPQENGQTANSSYIGNTASELLSNQLSNWISQNKYNIGIGLNYRPGDEVTNEEYEVSFSTQLFDNKMLVSGNLGYGRDATNTSNSGTLIGDFDVELKLNRRGNFRAKAYTHSNNDVVYETSPTTQGVGLSYSDDFDSFGQLLRRYWYILSGQRRRDRKAAEAAQPKDIKE